MKRLLDAGNTANGTPAATIETVAAGFSGIVIDWQKQAGRHALPWQRTRDAYRIWLSEIMLQQTQVATVIPYYNRFLERFPDVAALARAPTEEVMGLWSGLGYYTRARNLHRAAQQVVQQHAGQFPVDTVQLEALPGIGRSTAAAIAAFSTGARAAILDGNVKRVLARVFGIEGYPGQRLVEQRMWELAQALLPDTDMEAYTQGLMDIGATVCTRSRPQCGACPLATRCVALHTDRVSELPERKPRKAVPEKSLRMLILFHEDCIWLETRPANGIWGGLWSLPELSVESNQDDLLLAATAWGSVSSSRTLIPFRHAFTHYRLEIHPHWYQLDAVVDGAPDRLAGRWTPVAELATAPLPAPIKKLLLSLQQGVPGRDSDTVATDSVDAQYTLDLSDRS